MQSNTAKQSFPVSLGVILSFQSFLGVVYSFIYFCGGERGKTRAVEFVVQVVVKSDGISGNGCGKIN